MIVVGILHSIDNGGQPPTWLLLAHEQQRQLLDFGFTTVGSSSDVAIRVGGANGGCWFFSFE